MDVELVCVSVTLVSMNRFIHYVYVQYSSHTARDSDANKAHHCALHKLFYYFITIYKVDVKCKQSCLLNISQMDLLVTFC